MEKTLADHKISFYYLFLFLLLKISLIFDFKILVLWFKIAYRINPLDLIISFINKDHIRFV